MSLEDRLASLEKAVVDLTKALGNKTPAAASAAGKAATGGTSTPTQAAPAQSAPPAGADVDRTAANAATNALVKAGRTGEAKALLAKYGATKTSGIPAERIGEYVAEAEALVAATAGAGEEALV